QVTKYCRGRAPDVAPSERDGVEAEGEPVPVSGLTLVVLRRHQESERHFEGVVNLSLIEGDHRGIGVLLVVPRDHIWIGEPRRYIERKLFLRPGKKFRRSERAIVVCGGLNSRSSTGLVVARPIATVDLGGSLSMLCEHSIK